MQWAYADGPRKTAIDSTRPRKGPSRLSEAAIRDQPAVIRGGTWERPALSAYLARYPDIDVELTLSDRTMDLLDDGFDAAIRIGKLGDTRLIARPLAPYRMMICASPAYLAARGTPRHPN